MWLRLISVEKAITCISFGWTRNSISKPESVCRYSALGSFINMGIQGIAVATVLNRAGSYISPYNCAFPFYQDELPPSISSTAWNTLNFNATGTQKQLPSSEEKDMSQAVNGTVGTSAVITPQTMCPGAQQGLMHRVSEK